MIMLDGTGNGESSFPQGESTNDTPAVQRKSPKQEEEISVDDIPF